MHLLSKIPCQVNHAKLLTQEEGLLSVGNDKSLRVWLKRDNGDYWPSVCHYLTGIGLRLAFHEPTFRLFVALNNGSVEEFCVAEDYNSIQRVRDYYGHTGPVFDVYFAPTLDYVLSTGRDKTFNYFCGRTYRRIGRYDLESQGLCLAFDRAGCTAFIGQYNGSIVLLKISDDIYQQIGKLEGHGGSVRALHWHPQSRWLISGGFDRAVIVWDIGGKQGTKYELNYHTRKITGVYYFADKSRVLSTSDDKSFILWDVSPSAKRSPVTEWEDSAICQKCEKPFIFAIKEMYNQKKIGARQHHCRKCGKALCANCTPNTSRMPWLGFELPVRICVDCSKDIGGSTERSLAIRKDADSQISDIDIDVGQGLILTNSADNVIRIWDMTSILDAPI